MCGIAALIQAPARLRSSAILPAMTEAVAHRGPDGSGLVYLRLGGAGFTEVEPGQEWCVGLGHRRLSILDLSEAGRQPMAYGDQLWITYNGEVYNYLELRQELEKLGHAFRSRSDTEVILAAYQAWGTACFARFRGMWGLVLVDGRRRQAILCRDRLGIKPLYRAAGDGWLAAVSEIKQLLHLPWMQWQPDEEALRQYLLTGYESEQGTFFTDVVPVPAGHWQAVDLESAQLSAPEPYWFPERVRATIDDPGEAAVLFRRQFEEATRIHLRSDVPVGCSLSGGLDSSAVAACAAQRLHGAGAALQTFSVVFPGTAVDEASFVHQVVESVQGRPRFVTPTPAEFLSDLDRFVWVHDEPVGSLAQYAGYALARLTRSAGVPVTLNGQGGDEVFAGYWQSLFLHLRGLWRRTRLAALAGQVVGACLPGGNPELIRQVPAMARRYRARRHAAAELRLTSLNGSGAAAANDRLGRVLAMNDQERRIYELRHLYLPRLLKWDDRNFMAFGVEGRYPFLDHLLIETVLSFAPRALYERGWTKEPLRRGLKDLLPRKVLRRRTKFGFEVPQQDWLRGPLQPALAAWLKCDAPLWRHVNPAEVRALAETVWRPGRRDEEAGQALFRCFLADRWLRRFFN